MHPIFFKPFNIDIMYLVSQTIIFYDQKEYIYNKI